ncbi:MAG: response regulator transcription factor [Actinomycetota bacterium]|nr:response regulator transcription factor [Actinomycetota bacterium]
MKLSLRLHALLIEARESDGEDGSREREVALNVLLLVSLVLALVPGVQRVVQISHGGPDTSDHVHTLVVVGAAAVAFGLLLWLSRHGKPRAAAWLLLGVYFGVSAWSIVAEGAGKTTTILLCAMFLVAAGALCGSRPAVLAALLLVVTLALVEALDSMHVLTAPRESSPAVPDVATFFEIVGAFGAMVLVLAVRSQKRPGPVVTAELRENSREPRPGEHRSGTLTVREVQVVRLVALGRSNDEISRELVVSPRTVHSHVSSALRKTRCANRTELAVLVVREGLTEPQ